ncbi:MAG: glycogen debranching enzyme family protein [Bacteroidales bacterium]|nr:glycogen debranching enzyme family protein [Bacteroidales bacterium]
MSFLDLNKSQLINLSYSLSKEIIRSNRSGSYASTTIIGCNTRKYHGLLVAPQPQIDQDRHVFLSSVDETVIQNGKAFNLGIRKYHGGVFEPKGHKYIKEFKAEPNFHTIYRVGGVILKKEYLLIENEPTILICYTLEEAHSSTKLQVKPFLAFRNFHQLSHANFEVNTGFKSRENGSEFKLYPAYDSLYIQASKKVEYVHFPNWYYKVEYQEEQARGYEYQEDLLMPGMFEFDIKKGETVIIAAGLQEIKTKGLKLKYQSELKKRIPRNDLDNCLTHAAKQFIVQNKHTEIIAGFPWFGRWGRDTFIALPGLTCAIGDNKTCLEVLKSMSSQIKDGLFPNIGADNAASYNSIDAPLWYFWSIQQYYSKNNDAKAIWKLFSDSMLSIINTFKRGTHYNIALHDNGLIYGGDSKHGLTWMDAVVFGEPVTPRTGYAVEINALWYNALLFTAELAVLNKQKELAEELQNIASKAKATFNTIFWDDMQRRVADFVNFEDVNFNQRANQIFAVSLPYAILEEDRFKCVVDKVKSELLTPKGLRTLTPRNKQYKGQYKGNQEERDRAYHQGTVWPWLLGGFVDAYLKVYSGESAINFVEQIYKNFEPDMLEHGLGTVSEVYDGDPPHQYGGTISQAWSVAELLRIKSIINDLRNNHK